MAELDKVIKALELCCYRDETFRNPLEHGFNCANCTYFSECDKIHSFCGDKLKKDALELLKAQEEIIQELINVGVPHNFQREQPWLVTYMYKITAIVQKAFKLKDEE